MGDQTFRVAAVGGSLTTGYAVLVAQGLRSPIPGLDFVNHGVNGIDSARAAARISSYAEGADLVILEFTDDQGLDPTVRRQAYEGCLRQVLALPSRPRVLCVLLAAEQRIIADHYGVPWFDAGQALGPVGGNPGDPTHPIAQGHQRIAEAVLNALEPVLAAPTPAPAEPRLLRDPLYSSDWQFVRLWDHGNTGQGDLAVEVAGKVVGVFATECGHDRALEAWIDEPVPVVLGGAFRILARNLTDGPHRVQIRCSPGREASPAPGFAVLAAGVADTGHRFVQADRAYVPLAAPAHLPLVWTGRFDPAALPGARFGWQLTRLSGRFTGPRLVLSFSEVLDRNYFDVAVDGRSRVLELLAASPRTVAIADNLGPGEHRLEVVKRSEGLFGSAVLAGLGLAPGERWLEPPTRLPYRLEIYGDSISAGACNEDGAVDQYDTLAPHDPNLSYGAIAARRLGAEVVNLAVSGTGLTCSWNPILMPDVWDRAAPDPSAPRIAADRPPHAVVVNLGQNDYGFPNSQGRPFDPDYGPRLKALVLGLRARYPETWIVGALGGMTGWRECEPLRRLWSETFDDLQAADPRIRSFFFQAASSAHPRVDVHALLAEELTTYLAREVWPHLETPLH